MNMEFNEEALNNQIKEAANKLRSRMKMTITAVGNKGSRIETNVPPLVYVPVLMSIVSQEIAKLANDGKTDKALYGLLGRWVRTVGRSK